MSKLLSSTLLLFCILSANAQTPIPDYGKVEKADLEMTTCSFDKNSEAMVLFDAGEFYCKINYNLSNPVMILNERHVRIKILNDKGLSWANVRVRYQSYMGAENVRNISAQTYNLDASGNIVISKLEKSLIYDKKIDKRFSEVVFTLPEVKAGSVIEYKYSVEGAENFEWYFQKSIPVLLSNYKINFPPELEIATSQNCTLPVISTSEKKSGQEIHNYRMENIPALRDEPFISCDFDYLQRIEARISAMDFPGNPRKVLNRSWFTIVKKMLLDDDFGAQLKKNIPRTEELENTLKTISSPLQKLQAVHKYVSSNMQWNGINYIWTEDGVKSAWKDKKGTSAEINLILVNLLNGAGINAHPLLVSTRANGQINTLLPGYRQFDKVMAYTEINNKMYVLDATDKFTPPWLIPTEVLYTEGLVIDDADKGKWGWKTLWEPSEIFKNNILLQAEMDSTGLMKGEASIYSEDYARLERMPKMREGNTPLIKAFIQPNNPAVKIENVTVQNEKTDSLPLIQTVSFSNSPATSGEYKYFTVNLFSGLEKNVFTADTRVSDIYFGYNQAFVITGSVALPDNYEFDELPKNIRMMTPDTGIVFKRIAGVEDNRLSIKLSLDFKKPVYNIEEYPEFKEFYKKLFDLLNEQIVVRQKK